MKKNSIFKTIALVAFVTACFINFKTVIKNNGKVDSSVTLSTMQGVMNAEAECYADASGDNNGDCVPNSSGGYCEVGGFWDDCQV
jgi:hypothetical protein